MTFRSASPATAVTSASAASVDLTIARPTALAVNDVMLVVMRWSGSGGTAVATTWSAPSGWTELDHNDSTGNSVGSTALWWKRATTADVSATGYTFTPSWSGGAKDAIASAGLIAFSGVTPTGSPFAWSSTAQVQGNPPQSSITYPRGTGTYESGGMSVSLAGFRRVKTTCCTVYTGDTGVVDVTSTSTGTLGFSAPVTGNAAAGLSSSAAYHPASASGQYPAATTQTLSAATNWSAWTLILVPAPPCGAGGLNLSAPSTISFGTTTLDGADHTPTTTAAITVDDQTGAGAGWALSISPTRFTSGGAQLPVSAVAVTGGSQTNPGGRCSAPVNTVSYAALSLPAGVATKVFNAAAGGGAGPSAITLGLALAVPANTRIGTYSSTWTMTLASGP